MLGLELVMGGLLELAAGGSCAKQKFPSITAQPVIKTVDYDFSKDRGDLQGFDIDTVSPYGPGHHAKIGGLMSGEIRVESRIRFMQEKYPAYGKGCVHIDGIELTIHVNPTIYVAREYRQGSCQHRAIIEHEKQHVQIDTAIARKHAIELRNMLSANLRSSGYSFGPYPLETFGQAQQRIQGKIHALIEESNDTMTRGRMKEQQQLDSLEEYERVSAQCKGGLATSPDQRREPKARPRSSTRRHYNQ